MGGPDWPGLPLITRWQAIDRQQATGSDRDHATMNQTTASIESNKQRGPRTFGGGRALLALAALIAVIAGSVAVGSIIRDRVDPPQEQAISDSVRVAPAITTAQQLAVLQGRV